jgi:hypothetical protein
MSRHFRRHIACLRIGFDSRKLHQRIHLSGPQVLASFAVYDGAAPAGR